MEGKIRIGIIGAGMGGCAASYYLRNHFKDSVEIVVFEGSDDAHIGGRVKSVMLNNFYVECGGSVFLEQNRYMSQFVKDLQLTPINLNKEDENKKLVILGTKEDPLRFTTTGWPNFLTRLLMLYHYGWDLIKCYKFTSKCIEYFNKIYDLQQKGFAFTKTATFLNALAPNHLFINMTKSTLNDWLSNELKIKPDLIDELAYGLACNNYTQSSAEIHAFVGCIALATMTPTCRAVKEGNESVPKKLIDEALKMNSDQRNHYVRLATVEEIARIEKNRWKLFFKMTLDNKMESEEFDYVIIACPLHQFNKLKAPQSLLPEVTIYRDMNVSNVIGDLEDSSLWLPKETSISCSIVVLNSRQSYETVEGQSKIFSVIQKPKALLRPNDKNAKELEAKSKDVNNTFVFFTEKSKIPEPNKDIPKEFFRNGKVTDIVTTNWLAYPLYTPCTDPSKELGDFTLAPGLFYANAIEKAASCMEIAAIGAKNVVNLLLIEHRQKTDEGCPDLSSLINPIYKP